MTKLDVTIARTQARDALVSLGWKPFVARAAVDEAIAACGSGLSLEVLIREALRRCPLTRNG
jgi:Holliday junction resolvasome RuvABC DNA-binding subunit